ncbi:MAG: pyruvate formate lyase family protein [Thermodesulfobacteriota bacterium]
MEAAEALKDVSLSEKISIKAVRNIRRGQETEEGRKIYRPGVRVCLERNRLLTESYKMTEGEPIVLRQARALEHILLNMTIYIRDWEKIVGNYASSPDAVFWPIEQNWKSVHRLLNSEEGQALIDDEGRKELDRIVAYWNGKTVSDIRKRAFAGSPELEKYWVYEGTMLWSQWSDQGVPNYEKVLSIGLNGIIGQAEEKLEALGKELPGDYIQRKDFLEAVVIALKAAIKWAERYAVKAEALAEKEKDAGRKKDLLEIARICRKVPAYPASTFREALQSFIFIHLIGHQIEFITLGCGIRFDMVMEPFFQKDLVEGRITREEAIELIKHTRLHLEELGQMYSPTTTQVYGGVQVLQSLVIGGIDAAGRDVSGETSYLLLDSVIELKTLQPSIVLRVHDGTPKRLILKAIEVIKTGVGYPSFQNDKALIPLMMKWNCPIEDARNYTTSGCVYLDVPGKNILRRNATYFSLPRCLWWALHRGVNPRNGQQYGAATKDPAGFASLDDVLEAYLEQVRFFMEKQVKVENVVRTIYAEHYPRPFESALTDGCLERGRDLRKWRYQGRVESFSIAVGPTNVADSLAAINKVVFDEKRITLKKLVEVMDKNWEGHEDLRLRMLAAPKFGNDDDYVDKIAYEVHLRTEEVVERFSDTYGSDFHLDGSAVSATYGLSLDTPATPDGRKNGDGFADGSLSPMPGRDVNGPTAVLKSCSKIDALTTYNHLLNQKFSPQFLEDDYMELFYSYLRSWADLGIPHIQFNVVDRKTLIEAQKNPEKHRDLAVRVAGYSAYFIDLSKGLQDHIIERTEQSFS